MASNLLPPPAHAVFVPFVSSRGACHGVRLARRSSPSQAVPQPRPRSACVDAAAQAAPGHATHTGTTVASSFPAMAPLTATVSHDVLRAPVASDMETCRKNLLDVVGQRHPMLLAAANQIFSAGGKRLRPLIVLLVARATLPVTGML